jgi:lipid A disaccharide synthetase
MKILISAAEASSDAHGAELLRAIQAARSGGWPGRRATSGRTSRW